MGCRGGGLMDGGEGEVDEGSDTLGFVSGEKDLSNREGEVELRFRLEECKGGIHWAK